MLTIDRISKRYGILPSQALSSATTMDLRVANTAMAYEIYCQREAQKTTNAARGFRPAPQLSQEKMKQAMERVRNKND
jgi:uncharacterized membrane protein YebE (DUF533 family)